MKRIIKLSQKLNTEIVKLNIKIPSMAVGGDQEYYDGQVDALNDVLEWIDEIYTKKEVLK